MRRELWEMLQCSTCSGLKTMTYKNLGIRPLLIDKLSNYSNPKLGVPLLRTGSHLPTSYVTTEKEQRLKAGCRSNPRSWELYHGTGKAGRLSKTTSQAIMSKYGYIRQFQLGTQF